VGATTARALAAHFGDLDAILDADEDALRAVDDVGPESGRIHPDVPRQRGESGGDRWAPRERAGRSRSVDVETGDALDGLTFFYRVAVDDPGRGAGARGGARRRRHVERLGEHRLPRRRRESGTLEARRRRRGRACPWSMRRSSPVSSPERGVAWPPEE